jgi:hypothetical protein
MGSFAPFNSNQDLIFCTAALGDQPSVALPLLLALPPILGSFGPSRLSVDYASDVHH